jgi:hypothetical protein|tara:strand:+ start:2304 stop:2465 length:162 start_codon:yes stop_codon:yes gene_type:complete
VFGALPGAKELAVKEVVGADAALDGSQRGDPGHEGGVGHSDSGRGVDETLGAD